MLLAAVVVAALQVAFARKIVCDGVEEDSCARYGSWPIWRRLHRLRSGHIGVSSRGLLGGHLGRVLLDEIAHQSVDDSGPCGMRHVTRSTWRDEVEDLRRFHGLGAGHIGNSRRLLGGLLGRVLPF